MNTNTINYPEVCPKCGSKKVMTVWESVNILNKKGKIVTSDETRLLEYLCGGCMERWSE